MNTFSECDYQLISWCASLYLTLLNLQADLEKPELVFENMAPSPGQQSKVSLYNQYFIIFPGFNNKNRENIVYILKNKRLLQIVFIEYDVK